MLSQIKLSFSVSTRMVWSLTLLLTAFVCLLALSIPNSDRWQMQFLHVVLMLVVLSNVGVNVLQVLNFILRQ